MATITVTKRGYTATLDTDDYSVSISQDGVWAGTGVWYWDTRAEDARPSMGAIDQCAAVLGGSQQVSEGIYDALDTALGDELAELEDDSSIENETLVEQSSDEVES